MCGRFAFVSPAENLRRLFGLSVPTRLPDRYNLAPTQAILAVHRTETGIGADDPTPGLAYAGDLQVSVFRWGLIPDWAKDPDIGSRLINARAETVQEKPSFRTAFRRRRCLIPASGFYEWRKSPKGKQPYYISMADDGPMVFAGLWERWQGADGSDVETCTIVTTDAIPALRPIHERMPVILDAPDFRTWLTGEAEAAAKLLRPYAGGRDIHAWPVSRRVNAVANDEAALIVPTTGDGREAQPEKAQFDLF